MMPLVWKRRLKANFRTMTTIEIPDGLRSDIECVIEAMNTRQADAAEKRAALIAERELLKAQLDPLKDAIYKLHHQVLADASATDDLVRAETRLRVLNGRLEELGTEIEGLRPLTLNDASAVLQRVVDFYAHELKDKIADALEPFCPNRSRAREIAGFSDAMHQLRSVANRAARLPMFAMSSGITPGMISEVEKILRRALAGSPLLGQDAAPEKEPAGS